MTGEDSPDWSPFTDADIAQIAASPFAPKRPYFDGREFDQIARSALAEAGCLPEAPGPVRIERFIEKRFGITPRYKPRPPSELGVSLFGEQGVDGVIVSSSIERRRQNSTLAHEAGHLLLHTGFITCGIRALKKAQPLGGVREDVRGLLCKDKPPGYSGQWWEFQANQMIGPLLLPRDPVAAALRDGGMLVPHGTMGGEAVDGSRWAEAAALLSRIFDVHPVVARLRLEGIWPAPPVGQLPF